MTLQVIAKDFEQDAAFKSGAGIPDFENYCYIWEN